MGCIGPGSGRLVGDLYVSRCEVVMNRVAGFLVSEIVTAALVVIICIAVAFGISVGNERDSMVESATASLEAIKERATAASEGGELIACDNTLVDAVVLENRFLKLEIKPTAMNKTLPVTGYGAGVYISSNKKLDGNDTFNTAERLFKILKKKEADALRVTKIEDDEIEYSVLLSDTANCDTTDQLTP